MAANKPPVGGSDWESAHYEHDAHPDPSAAKAVATVSKMETVGGPEVVSSKSEPTTPAAPGIDPADPWRGLYAPELMPKLDGVDDYFAVHPDVPEWPDDDERSIAPLIAAQGFAHYAITADYPWDEGESGEEFDTCAWLANWKPEPPAGEQWRLVMIHDTEDGPAAIFVRPLALIEQVNYERMFNGACDDMARILNALGVGGPCYNGPGMALAAIAELKAAIPVVPAGEPVPRSMVTAPRDGTMLRLLVQFDDHATEDTEDPAWTIGACNDDNVHQDERVGWQFAGWCWDHDHFTEGKGTPVGWLPLIDASPKERAFLQTVEGLEFDAPMDAVVHESPKGAVPRSDLVPGVVRCAKCSFQLARTNLYLGSGTTGHGDSKAEPCPNGCGPLWPVTWQTWATEGWQQAERYLEELRQLQAGPKGGRTDENNDLLPELRDVEDYFTSVDPNPIHLATVRQAINVIVGSLKGGSDAYAAALVQAMRDARAGVFDQERHVIATLNWLENRASKIVSVQATSAEVGA